MQIVPTSIWPGKPSPNELAISDDEVVARAKAAKAAADGLEPELSSNRWTEADCYAELASRGWTQKQVAVECDTAQSTICKYIACVKKYSVPNNRPSFWEAYREVDGKPRVTHNSGNAEWYTPPEYVAAARAVMGGVDLDPASCAKANETVDADTFYTQADDGLSREWFGRVWMNPPYNAGLINKFCEKLCSHFENGDISEAIVLTNNGTDASWFHRMAGVASRILFVRGRIAFVSEFGRQDNTATQGQVILYFGNNDDRFAEEFGQFGLVTTAVFSDDDAPSFAEEAT
jgi:ParB family chromosome partitioning protein